MTATEEGAGHLGGSVTNSHLIRPAIRVLALALVLRVVWAITMRGEQVSDARAYELLATQLASGGYYGFDGAPYAYWPVGYPFFLSLHYRLFGDASWAITATSVLLSLSIVALTIVIARQWLGDCKCAIVAGVIIAAYPVHIQLVSTTACESLFTVLLLGAVVAAGAKGSGNIRLSLVAGILLGLAAYVRPVGMVLVPALAVARLAAGERWKRTLVEAALVGTVAMLVVAPWTYRNYRIYNRFVFVSTNGGMCLFFGNNPITPGKYQEIVKPPFAGNDAERDKYCARLAVEYIKSDPTGFVVRSLRKAVRLWERDTIGAHWNASAIRRRFGEAGIWWTKVISQAYWVALGVGAIIGTSTVLRRRGWRKLASFTGVWLCIAFTLLHAITYSQDRYHFPLVPFLAILVVATATRSRSHSTTEAPA